MDRNTFTIFFLIAVGVAVAVSVGGRVSEYFSSRSQRFPVASSEPQLDGEATSSSQAAGFVEPSPGPKRYSKPPDPMSPAELKNKKVAIITQKGIIEFEIYPEATKAATNFMFLAGDKFYDGLKFHRVEKGFVVQGGDPLGNGTGGPGYWFEDDPVTRKYDKGTVAMANAGPDTNGSQFFIMLEDNPDLLPNYTIFGKVIKGQSVVDKIEVGDVMESVRIEKLK